MRNWLGGKALLRRRRPEQVAPRAEELDLVLFHEPDYVMALAAKFAAAIKAVTDQYRFVEAGQVIDA